MNQQYPGFRNPASYAVLIADYYQTPESIGSYPADNKLESGLLQQVRQ